MTLYAAKLDYYTPHISYSKNKEYIMGEQAKVDLVINVKEEFVFPMQYESFEADRLQRKQRLAASCRLFGKFGFDEGAAGHITVRDPEHKDHFWVNPMGVSFKQIKVSDLIKVNHAGEVVEGNGMLNGAAFTIHANIHAANPEIDAAAHAHSICGKSWSSLGRKLDPITQDACAFYDDHILVEEFTGVVLEKEYGEEIGAAIAGNKAAILQNHGLLTVGKTVDAAVWWYITMERSCQAQLMAEAAGTPKIIGHDVAKSTCDAVGSELAGWFSYQTLYNVIIAEQPDLLD
jgi:ribulose-5-phosphate 4-epimerase/fuculose-1-phosphate aldolase